MISEIENWKIESNKECKKELVELGVEPESNTGKGRPLTTTPQLPVRTPEEIAYITRPNSVPCQQ